MNPTIHDVARMANTSKSTVSRYLNGEKVKKETQEALDQAIVELNYHRNANARRLVMNKTQIIGVIVDDIANNFYSGIIRGIEEVVAGKGFNCVFLSWNANYHSESSYIDLIYEGQFDGLIFVSFRTRKNEELMKIKETSCPVVLVGDYGDIDNIYAVDVDNSAGIAEVVTYLNRIGHEKIAYISGPDQFAASKHRFRGYKQTIEALDLEYNPDWIVDSNWSNEGGYAAMEEILKKGGITAVVASNDETAIGALSAIHERGFNVPRDFSIVGFDDIPISSWVFPTLTTVRQPLKAIGMKAAEGLFSKLEGRDSDQMKHLLKPELIIRNSCAKL